MKITDYQNDTERVTEWEMGLPTAADLTPLSQPLIPPELASAFSISPEPYRTLLDVNRASHDTISAIRGGGSQAFSNNNEPDEELEQEQEEQPDRDGSGGSESRKLRRLDSAEEADSAPQNIEDPSSARTVKRPRLVWTPQLHKRFVDVVAHLGIKNAVPKTIMQLMNVEGLTRENVASHLQKYRLYLKRMQGLSNEGPSSSDQLFASTPVPHSFHDSGTGNGHLPPPPMPYPPPPPPHMMAMSVIGMPHHHHHHGFNNNYNAFQQRDWSSSYPHTHTHTHHHTLTPTDK